MINVAKGEASIRAEPKQFDADPWLLGCEDVTFDLRTRKPHAPRREDFITKSTGVVPDRDASCPNWLATLDWAMQGDVETIEHLQRIAGYMLTGLRLGGKALRLLRRRLEWKDNDRHDALQRARRICRKGPQRRALAVTRREGRCVSGRCGAPRQAGSSSSAKPMTGCAIAEAQVKAITSNEPIPARKLHRDPFTFNPSHKVLLMTNHRPFVKGSDDGIWRRMNIIGFNAKIADEDKDPNFREEKLRQELPGILAWMIKGCFKWQLDGLKPSAAVKHATAAYRSEMDFIQQWLDERTVVDPQGSITRCEAYGNYKLWSELEHAPTVGNRRFVEELHGRGLRTTKSNGVRLFRGLRLQALGPGLHLVAGTAANP